MKYEEIINGLISGQLKSPYIDNESIYLPIRITGTGITERAKKDLQGNIIYDENNEPILIKYNRPKEEFLTENFLNACKGTPVLLDHPEGGIINGENYQQSVIGTIVEAYVKDNQVWGIARIFTPHIFECIKQGIKSTSPSIITSEIEQGGVQNEVFKRIDHVAIVPKGYWDMYTNNEAIKIDSANNNCTVKADNNITIIGGLNMADENKELENNEEPKNDNLDDAIEGKESEESQKIALIEKELAEIKAAIMPKQDEGEAEEVANAAKGAGEDVVNAVVDSEEGKAENLETEEAQGSKLDAILKEIAAIKEIVMPKQEEPKEEPKPIEEEEAISGDDILDVEDEEKKNVIADKLWNLRNSTTADIKIPTDKKETMASYLRRALGLNKSLVDEKYKSTVDRWLNKGIEKGEVSLAVDALNTIEKNAIEKTNKEHSKNTDRWEEYVNNGVKNIHNVFHK